MARTRRQRVHDRLVEADGEWVCSRTLCHPQVGGRRAAARIWELRRDGLVVETKTCACEQCRYSRLGSLRRNEPPTRLAAYRLVEAATERRAS